MRLFSGLFSAVSREGVGTSFDRVEGRDPRSGMTLMELLAAMTIFLGLAGMVMQVLGGGLDLWSSGERSRDLSESTAALFDRMETELRHAVAADAGDGEPRIKMFSDFVEMDSAVRGVVDFRSQRLLFVRHLFEERSDPRLQGAGLRSGDGDWFVGQRELLGAREAAAQSLGEEDARAQEQPFLRATESLTEVAWLPEPDHRPGHEGRLVLWRALRSPIGGADSLFRSVADRDGGLRDAEAHVMAENLLYLGFEFLDGRTDLRAQPDQTNGPSLTWDSTRGMLPAGDSLESFRYAIGPRSLANPDDDVFPSAVRIRVALELPADEARSAFLVGELSAGDRTPRIQVRNAGALRELASGGRMKIGHEWVEVSGVRGDSVQVQRRGLLGTVAVAHPDDTPILVGSWAERTVRLPQSRQVYVHGARR